jgi:hypothetical protein
MNKEVSRLSNISCWLKAHAVPDFPILALSVLIFPHSSIIRQTRNLFLVCYGVDFEQGVRVRANGVSVRDRILRLRPDRWRSRYACDCVHIWLYIDHSGVVYNWNMPCFGNNFSFVFRWLVIISVKYLFISYFKISADDCNRKGCFFSVTLVHYPQH